MSTVQQLVLASGNQGKLAELTELLSPLAIQVRLQAEFSLISADETGLTFVENAILKARHAARHTGLPALADDSGLEVDALHGAPGIYSARYAQDVIVEPTDTDNNDKLVDALKQVSMQDRTARYHCVLVLMKHALDPTPLICHATWEGKIVDQPQGTHGFGYDAHFYLPDFGCTAAELDPQVKSKYSHRGRALQQLLTQLQ